MQQSLQPLPEVNSGPTFAIDFEEEGALLPAGNASQDLVLQGQAKSKNQVVSQAMSGRSDTLTYAIARKPIPTRARSIDERSEEGERRSRASRFEAALARQAAVWLMAEEAQQDEQQHQLDLTAEDGNMRCIDGCTDSDGITSGLTKKANIEEAETPESDKSCSFSEGSEEIKNTTTASTRASSNVSGRTTSVSMS